MKESIIRTVSGLLYISMLVVSILSSELVFISLFFVLGFVCLLELEKLLHLKSYAIYAIHALIFYLFSYLKFNANATLLLLCITIFVNLFLIKDLLFIRTIPVFEKKKYIILIFYLSSSIIFLTLIPTYTGIFNPQIIVGVFVLIWTNDTFAYITGKNFGKNKLYERISPNKTVEGFIGGMVFSAVGGYCIFYFTHYLNFQFWLGLAIILSIFGTLGDLIQSKFKRQAGVKDSGKLMPGHGGLFDRLDSIIFSSPFVYAYLLIINHVS
ncbi:phosphatidate cytidylyltransferase [Gillisia sp. Hel1_33_143]|uniref:phosphatidate cytidylyltransferase n=1 Tax=unclassified Gillisia TaxID=2615025 RepID=UPI00054E8671|nr:MULTISPECIES: phosphatidate cytidylyltransferase [unclassified Gillisia]SDR66636.1 phosphatidate cytidylyltransferase [Gillisia sp. Hel1_33_143]